MKAAFKDLKAGLRVAIALVAPGAQCRVSQLATVEHANFTDRPQSEAVL